MSPHNGIGSPAPPLHLPTATGEAKSLADWRGRPVIVSFLGPAHCAFCRAHVIRLIQARMEFESAGAEVVLVVHDDPSLLMTQMLKDLQVPFTLLVDRTRETYARWGLGLDGWRSVVQPGLYWALIKQRFRGERNAEPPMSDGRQLGGDFVIDRQGRLTLAHRLKSYHDRAPISRLVETLRRA